MIETKLLDLANSKAVVWQPWANHPTLAKMVAVLEETEFSREKNSYNSLRMTRNFQAVLAMFILQLCLQIAKIFLPQCFRLGQKWISSTWCTWVYPHIVQAPKSPMGLFRKYPWFPSLIWTELGSSFLCQ